MPARPPAPTTATAQEATSPPRPLRADARRNRARVLDAAREAFAADGLAVPLDEIARRAGVGAGTVHRHFPTKEVLYEAILVENLEAMVDRVRPLTERPDAGAAFFELLTNLVEYGAANQGFADALPASTARIPQLAAHKALTGAYVGLLARAQQAGAVRGEVTDSHITALVHGILAASDALGGDPAERARITAIVRDGLRPRPD